VTGAGIRPALSLVQGGGEDQVARLKAFREKHPQAVIGTLESGAWQALIPEPDGETVITRYHLRDFLDRLDELLSGESG
jgi:hypothetical protein